MSRKQLEPASSSISHQGESISNGDFILVDYVGRVKDTGTLFDLTLEDVARREKVYREDETYGPRLVVVGEGLMLKGFDEALTSMKVGESKSIELPPEKAFGPRDTGKVKIYPVSAFRKSDVKPYVGARVTMEGKTGIVQSVGGGRVRVDFNPLLAGKTLTYEIAVKGKLVTETDKLNELIKRRIRGTDPASLKVAREGDTISMTVPKDMVLADGIQLAKTLIGRDILKNVGGVSIVKFIEVFDKDTFKIK